MSSAVALGVMSTTPSSLARLVSALVAPEVAEPMMSVTPSAISALKAF